MIATYTVQNISGGTIAAGTTVDANAAIFDHAAMVTALTSRSDGFDLVMLDESGNVVPLVGLANANTATGRLKFNVTTSFANGVTLNYTLHHGNLGRQVDPFTASVSGAANVACVATFASASLPVPSFSMESAYDRRIDAARYPDTLSTRANYRRNPPRATYRLRWDAIDPAEWYEIRAFLHAQRGGASSFDSATYATFLPSATYCVRPGSASFSQASRTRFSAEMTVDEVAA